MNVLKMNPCDDEFSFSFADGVLTIQNGIQGTTAFNSSSVVMLTGCNDDAVCDNPMKVTTPPQLIVWGSVVDCCSNEKKKVALNPSDFGYATPEELQTAINQATKVPGEILTIEKETGLTLGGKPVYKKAIRVSGFVTGAKYTHNLGVDNYLSVNVFSWVAAAPADKRKLTGQGTGRTTFMYTNLESNAFQAITTAATYDELLIVLEYTKL